VVRTRRLRYMMSPKTTKMVTKQSTTKVVMMAVVIFLEDDWGAVVWDAEWDAECEVRVGREECEVAGVLEGGGAGVVGASRTVYLKTYIIFTSEQNGAQRKWTHISPSISTSALSPCIETMRVCWVLERPFTPHIALDCTTS
jgi:hypothetical protein